MRQEFVDVCWCRFFHWIILCSVDEMEFSEFLTDLKKKKKKGPRPFTFFLPCFGISLMTIWCLHEMDFIEKLQISYHVGWFHSTNFLNQMDS